MESAYVLQYCATVNDIEFGLVLGWKTISEIVVSKTGKNCCLIVFHPQSLETSFTYEKLLGKRLQRE